MTRIPRLAAGAALACLAALAAPAFAAPQVTCGDTLYASVVLTADVVCGRGADGLYIGADKVRIDLNGFSIEGPYTFASPTAPATGVFSSGYWGVQIVGPGRIAGFLQPIDIAGGGNHLVSGIEVTGESGLGVSMLNASGSLIESSRLPYVMVAADPRSRATGNRIIGNDVGPYPGLPGGGIALRGCEASDNMIAGNTIRNYGGPYEGIDIESSNGRVRCAGAILPSSKNIVRDNRVRGGSFGVLIDATSPPALSSGNVVAGNTFTDQSYSGLIFGAGAAYNDARGNTYVNLPLIAYDFGVGNLWP